MGVSEKTITSYHEIIELIPQRAPMVMIDSFFGISDHVSTSALTITKENLFSTDEGFDECGIMEHIAQSAAARVGYICKNSGEEIPLGYIGSINKCKIYALPQVGKTLITQIRIEQEVMNITLISATVTVNDEVVAECQMKIYLPD